MIIYMIQIQFPQLNNHIYEDENPDYAKPMQFYISEALNRLQKSIPIETRFILKINDQEKDITDDLSILLISTASKIKILLNFQIKIVIIFETQEEQITLDYNCFDNLFWLEKQLKKTHNISPYQLNFFHKQNKLHKDKPLIDLPIENDNVINCQIIGTYLIKYEVETSIEINIYATIDQVYQQVQQCFNLQQEFQLYFQETLLKKKTLDRDLLFYETQIKPYSEIKLKITSKVAMYIYIDTIKKFECYLVSQDLKLKDLKNYLIELCQIDKLCQYQFVVENQILFDDQFISHLSKQQLNNVITLKAVDESIKFYICEKDLDCFKIIVEMNQNTQIQDLQNLKQLTGQQCQFYFKNQLLKKEETFQQINLKNKDIIYYEIQST
ncbi:unnamed protein product (macronuclear) [Paramecium tetraurelia]|uniref:Ubiquitin-like domain-containing protein n=1 Tax=Paramecium tetraurelia TaxID=5888 RepID=A0C4G9_PARTE|nr:uncharacterized protein GSPATT00035166001 [Paramecium tetraurelia]CAK65686.1 unnamed protein product [Paramecium tetraurelia]|eukprot:XP_001433083.1 hypothetical protein (macronuclear) [Paramecium tetraurelia strain d4-2]